jgi:excisionase family DNA binding protein
MLPTETYTIAEAAALTGLHRNTIRMRVKLGQLAADRAVGKFGEEYRISREALVVAGLLEAAEPESAHDAAEEGPTVSPAGAAHPPAETAPHTPSPHPSQELLGELMQRHEQAMFRLGFMEAELTRQKTLAANAEAQQAAARERELEVRELRRELERAQEREREIDELRALLREMERTTEALREEVERHRTAGERRWWGLLGRKGHPGEGR